MAEDVEQDKEMMELEVNQQLSPGQYLNPQ